MCSSTKRHPCVERVRGVAAVSRELLLDIDVLRSRIGCWLAQPVGKCRRPLRTMDSCRFASGSSLVVRSWLTARWCAGRRACRRERWGQWWGRRWLMLWMKPLESATYEWMLQQRAEGGTVLRLAAQELTEQRAEFGRVVGAKRREVEAARAHKAHQGEHAMSCRKLVDPGCREGHHLV